MLFASRLYTRNREFPMMKLPMTFARYVSPFLPSSSSPSHSTHAHTLELTKYQSCWRVGDGKIQRGNFLQNLDGNRHIVWHHVNNELEFAKYHTRWRVSDGSKIQWGNFLKNLGGSGCIVWQLVNNEARIKLYQTFRTDVGVAAAACNRCCAIRYIMW